MGFTDAIKSFYRRYFDFSTRSSPSEYWWFVLFQILVFVVAAIVFGSLAAATGAFESSDPPTWFYVLLAPLGLFVLANIIPGIAIVVRRFHDRNMSGWWYLLVIVLSIIPFIGFLVSIGMIVFLCLPGYPQPNKWGPNPLDNFGDTFA